jgi:DNA-binding response OmpR family regulator
VTAPSHAARAGRDLRQNGEVRILLVEDDSRMRSVVRRGLVEHGHAVDEAATGAAAISAAAQGAADVIVLDVMLPGPSGLQVVRHLRAAGDRTPVLLLTARDTPDDVVAGLDAGADDYLVKPFAFAVLLARLRALGRRHAPGTPATRHVADIVLDDAAHLVTRGGTPVALTPTEFALLACLMRNAGRVVTRQMLLEKLGQRRREVENNTLDAFIKSLRQKLDAGGRPRLIHTIRGVGYSLREEAEP